MASGPPAPSGSPPRLLPANGRIVGYGAAGRESSVGLGVSSWRWHQALPGRKTLLPRLITPCRQVEQPLPAEGPSRGFWCYWFINQFPAPYSAWLFTHHIWCAFGVYGIEHPEPTYLAASQYRCIIKRAFGLGPLN